MSGNSQVFGKFLNNVFPRMPDFYSMLNEQCDIVAEAGKLFLQYMEKNDAAKGEEVCLLEHKADDVKIRNLTNLNSTFATPIDREDIFRAISTIDMVLNYMKTTIREMQTLKVAPDPHTIEMAALIAESVESLRNGYAKLGSHPATAESDCAAMAKSERNIEKVYRRAIASLFSAEEQIKELKMHAQNSEIHAMNKVLDIFRRREIYRHLSNAGDEIKQAGSTLHDIVVQIV